MAVRTLSAGLKDWSDINHRHTQLWISLYAVSPVHRDKINSCPKERRKEIGNTCSVNKYLKNTTLVHFGTFATKGWGLSFPHPSALDTMGTATSKSNVLDEAS